MKVRIESTWQKVLQEEFEKPYFESLITFVRNEYESQVVYPAGKHIFKAFDACPFDQVKVVIVGQDPYHGVGQANGLSFSVGSSEKIPPSLKNIFKELADDLGTSIPTNGDLGRWANQGVLLLNATLTVRAKSPGSHQKKGWEEFTDAALKVLSERRSNIVFILWGAYAQKKGQLLNSEDHLVIKSAHPSPFSAHSGFFGSNPFSKANNYLVSNGQKKINW